uniref:Uncharacterized protein n=1 Tax=Steinernema glaseri TaxID=37863 RepID=A0A1I7ZSK3_9BILA
MQRPVTSTENVRLRSMFDDYLRGESEVEHITMNGDWITVGHLLCWSSGRRQFVVSEPYTISNVSTTAKCLLPILHHALWWNSTLVIKVINFIYIIPCINIYSMPSTNTLPCIRSVLKKLPMTTGPNAVHFGTFEL